MYPAAGPESIPPIKLLPALEKYDPPERSAGAGKRPSEKWYDVGCYEKRDDELQFGHRTGCHIVLHNAEQFLMLQLIAFFPLLRNTNFICKFDFKLWNLKKKLAENAVQSDVVWTNLANELVLRPY